MEQDVFHRELYTCQYLGRNDIPRGSYVSGRFLLLCTHSGTARFLLNGKSQEVDARKFMFLHPHVEIQLQEASEDFRVCCISFMMELEASAAYDIPPSFFAHVIQNPIWEMDEATQKACYAFCTMFDYNCNIARSTNSAHVAATLHSVFLLKFYEKVKPHLRPMDADLSTINTRSLMVRFIGQLNLHYRTNHQVNFYASQIYISPKYLTQVVKKICGITPKEMIDRKLAVESLYLLSKSKMSIQGISNELGFPDQSYFGRFFKRIFGMSPMAFRMNPDLSLMERLKMVKYADIWNEIVSK